MNTLGLTSMNISTLPSWDVLPPTSLIGGGPLGNAIMSEKNKSKYMCNNMKF